MRFPWDLEKKMAAFVVDASTNILRKKRELTAVLVEHVDPDCWFAGGPTLVEQEKSTFWLDIKTVDGTNTKEEKASFVAAIFKGMGELLGDLHAESYVYVDEVHADAYGFGGKTQEFRYCKSAQIANCGSEPVAWSLCGLVQSEPAQVLGIRGLRRASEKGGKGLHAADAVLLRLLREMTGGHIIDHGQAKRVDKHTQLLFKNGTGAASFSSGANRLP
jgi:4-oxalocrotonate tautomerase